MKSGFTLIELMVTALIASIVVMGMSMLVVGVTRANNRQVELSTQFQSVSGAFSVFSKKMDACIDRNLAVTVGDKGKSITLPSESATSALFNQGDNVMYRGDAGDQAMVLVEGFNVTFSLLENPERYRMVLRHVETGKEYESCVTRKYSSSE